MSLHHTKPISLNLTNSSVKYRFLDFLQKPIEIYVFIDPLCPECWSLEPHLIKLSIEYGRFFTIRPIINGQLGRLNKKQWGKPKYMGKTSPRCAKDSWSSAFFGITSMGIKAAGLQGKRAGRSFLRKIQEGLFFKNQNISAEDYLIQCAKECNLDIHEFINDLHSPLVIKALRCDLKLVNEMDIESLPSIVFFNQTTDEEGVKIAGLHAYETYVHILKEMLQKDPSPAKKPPLEEFLAFYGVVSDKEIANVYDWTPAETNIEMKKLQLKQKVKRISVHYRPFWKYIN